MRRIKNLDLFQKITVESISRPTLIGAIISITTVILIIYLLIIEIINFSTPIIKKFAIVNQDFNEKSTINTNLSIKLFNVPCAIVSIDQEDSIGVHKIDVKQNVNKMRLDKNNNQIMGTFSPYKLSLIEKSFEEKESCFIKSVIPINKAPGDIHISFHKFRDVWEKLKSMQKEFMNSANLSHKILSLSFGDSEVNNFIKINFGESYMITKNLPSFEIEKENKNNDFYNYDYYIKLIPHIFHDEINSKEYHTYEYSVSSKSKIIESEEEMPIIMINFDLSPITMKIIKQKKSLSKFAIHICAIIGGVFVMFSILNSLLLFLFTESENKFE